jgi:hypothetical protein
VLFLQNNASSHTGAITQQNLAELHFEVLKHPVCSSHLAPSDYHVFPNLKKHPKGTKFSTTEDVMYALVDWFAAQPSAFYGLWFKEAGVRSVFLNSQGIMLYKVCVKTIPNLPSLQSQRLISILLCKNRSIKVIYGYNHCLF